MKILQKRVRKCSHSLRMILQDMYCKPFLCYHATRKDETYVDGITMSTTMLDAHVATVVRFFVKDEKREGQ